MKRRNWLFLFFGIFAIAGKLFAKPPCKRPIFRSRAELLAEGAHVGAAVDKRRCPDCGGPLTKRNYPGTKKHTWWGCKAGGEFEILVDTRLYGLAAGA